MLMFSQWLPSLASFAFLTVVFSTTAACSNNEKAAEIKFSSLESISTFAGIENGEGSLGISWNDYNDDNHHDIFMANHMHFPSQLYKNQLGLWMEEVSNLGVQVGLDDHMLSWADFNGDGHSDATSIAAFHREKRLFLGDGQGTFQEYSAEFKLPDRNPGSGNSLLNADFNGDGWTDLWAINDGSSDQLLFNRDGNHFVDQAINSGIINSLWKRGGHAADLDQDGDIDVVLFSVTQLHLYINQGDGKFIDRTKEAGLDFFIAPHTGGDLGDFDNDGDLDILIPARGGSDQRATNFSILANNGNATFSDVSEIANIGFGEAGKRRGVFIDINNDGWLDIFITEQLESSHNVNHQLFMNNGDGSFAPPQYNPYLLSKNIGEPGAIALGDINSDGFVDAIVGIEFGNRQISGDLQILRNTNTNKGCKNWLKIAPRSTVGSLDEGSASVWLVLPDGRILHRQSASKQRPMAQDAPGLHFGLGCHEYAPLVLVSWPSGEIAYRQNIKSGVTTVIHGEIERQAKQSEGSQWGFTEDAVDTKTSLLENNPSSRAFYDQNAEKLGATERIWIDAFTLGVFTPRKRPPKLPWAVANKVKQQLKTKENSAIHIADSLNIRAWSALDRKSGKYWDIKGETRGYLASGWNTPNQILKRYGDALGKRILASKEGTVLGPLKFNSKHSLFYQLDIDTDIETIVVVRRGIRKETDTPNYDEVAFKIQNALKTRRTLEKETRTHIPDIGSLELSQYEQNTSTEQLELAQEHAPSDEALLYRHIFLSKAEDAETAKNLLSQGNDIQTVIAELDIPIINSRKARGAVKYYEYEFVSPIASKSKYAPEIIQLVTKMHPYSGQLSERIKDSSGFHYFEFIKQFSPSEFAPENPDIHERKKATLHHHLSRVKAFSRELINTSQK